MKILILLFALSFLLFTSASTIAAEKTTVKIKCKEMSCAGCKKKITGSIQTLDGIINVDVNLESKIITVIYDDSKTTPDKIIGAINEAGYDAELASS
jgi:copper chaperone CopZ